MEEENTKQKMTKNHFSISQPLRSAKLLMEKLYADDEYYLSARFAWTSQEDARKLYIYGAARQVQKACIALMSQDEFLSDPPKEPIDSTGRMIIESVLDSQNLWIRKLNELLVNLIIFSIKNDPLSYRIYINAENFETFCGRQSDLKSFFAHESFNVHSSISHYKERIDSDLKELGKTPWFLDQDKYKKQKGIFISAYRKYKEALKSASIEEKFILGFSYQNSFGLPSRAVHPIASSSSMNRVSFQEVNSNFYNLSLTCQHALSRMNAILDHQDPSDIQKFFDRNPKSPNKLDDLRREFEIGDIVYAGNDLAEIIERIESVYGYLSYKVRFLVRPPIPKYPEDYLISNYIVPVLRKSLARAFYEKNLASKIGTTEYNFILKMNNEELYESVKATFINMEKAGVLIKMLQNKTDA